MLAAAGKGPYRIPRLPPMAMTGNSGPQRKDSLRADLA